MILNCSINTWNYKDDIENVAIHKTYIAKKFNVLQI